MSGYTKYIRMVKRRQWNQKQGVWSARDFTNKWKKTRKRNVSR